MDKKFDIIVYGATGFTGSLCAKYLKENYSGLRWAVAGRNEEKLSLLCKSPLCSQVLIDSTCPYLESQGMLSV